jgi:hypothetical protein
VLGDGTASAATGVAASHTMANASIICRLPNVLPISGRAGTAPAFEQQESYLPARSNALTGYPAVAMCTVAS